MTSDEKIKDLIDKYLGILNPKNYKDGTSTEIEIIKEIGTMFISDFDLSNNIKKLISIDNFNNGMTQYLLNNFASLIDLCKELNYEEQYLTILHKKLNVDSANWVWDKKTVDSLIEATIIEYKLIKLTNTLIHSMPKDPSSIAFEWKNHLKAMKIPYEVLVDYIDDNDLFQYLKNHFVNNQNSINDNVDFLKLLHDNKEQYISFLNSQKSIFVKYIRELDFNIEDNLVDEIYYKIDNVDFFTNKYNYQSIVRSELEKYCNSKNIIALKELWYEKTGVVNPSEYSKKYLTPILVLIPKNEVSIAKKYFDLLNDSNITNKEAEDALKYLNSFPYWDLLISEEYRNNSFKERIIGTEYDFVPIEKIKKFLLNKIGGDVYDWYYNEYVKDVIKDEVYNIVNIEDIIKQVKDEIDQRTLPELKECLREIIENNRSIAIMLHKKWKINK